MESEEEYYKHMSHRERKRPHHHHHKRRRPHYRGKRRRIVLKKKLIWDRQSQYDAAVEDDDTAEIDLDEIDETQPYQETDYEDNSKLDNVKKKKQKPIENTPPPKLDRNYGQIFEPTNPALTGTHRNIPTEYFSKEQQSEEQQEDVVPGQFADRNEDMSNRRMDLDQFFDRTVGRGFRSAGELSNIDFDAPSNVNKNLNNITAFSMITTTASPNNVTSLTYRKNGKEKAVFDIPGRVRRVYSKWSKWSKCSAKCTTRRFK